MTHTTEQLEQMLANATPGPWQVSIDHGDEVMTGAGGESLMCDMTYYPWVPPRDDWPLIAASPTITAELIAARKRIAELEDALRASREVHCGLAEYVRQAKLDDTEISIGGVFADCQRARLAADAVLGATP